MTASSTREIIARAGAAQPTIARLGLDRRLALLARARDALASAEREIVATAVEELRQPVRFARREMSSALALLDAMPTLCEQIRPRQVPSRAGTTILEWAPYGVVVGWHAANSPVWVPTVVAASALAGGNAVISRPSSRARRTTMRVLEALSAQWPTDSVTVADLPSATAEQLLWDEGVHAVVAHGSSETCKRHLAALGRAYERGATMRPYIPEASGNDALIVLSSADLTAAAEAVAVGGFSNSGQLCMAAKRVIVDRAVWPRFAPMVRERVGALRVGEPEDESTDIAPLPEGPARDRARRALAEALEAGGRIVVGEGERGGHFTPTIVELPERALGGALWSEEMFAPLRGLVVADGPEHALDLANQGPYGLGAAIFGEAPSALVDALRAARVVIGENPLYEDPHLVVGGIGDSGMAGARPKVEQLVFARRVHRAGG